MSGQLLSSKVVVVEEEPRIRGIPSAPTSVAGAVGLTQRGPIGKAVLCTSFEEFHARFGGFTKYSGLALAAMGFFENGGSQLWVVRTVHYADIADPTTATAVRAFGYLTTSSAPAPARVVGAPGPFVLRSGDRLVLDTGTGDQELVFQATAAKVTAAGPGPYMLADGQDLRLHIDQSPEQTLLFAATEFSDIANVSAADLVRVINQQILGGKAIIDSGVPALLSDTTGTASRIEVLGGSANTALGFPTDMVTGTGNVADIRAVTIEDIAALAGPLIPDVIIGASPANEIAIHTTATGTSATLQVKPATSAAFGLDTDPHTGSDTVTANAVRIEGKDPGAYANRIQVEVRPATSRQASAFDLAVIEDGVYRERFPNLTMAPDHERYIERVINHEQTGSTLIRTIDQLLTSQPALGQEIVPLTSGDDGLANLDDSDFIGSPVAKTGLHALDRIQALSLLLIPDRATAAVHNALVRYCQVDRGGMAFAVLDPPANQSATDIIGHVESTAALLELSEYAAIYWPRVQVLNPARSVFGAIDKIVAPPSGIIAGVYARTDAARPGGVYDPPAGIDKGRMFGVLGFETDEVLEEAKRDLVYPKRINPLTTGPGLPRYIDGSRTLKSTGNFPYVAERRGVIFIERSLRQGLQFARHKNNTEGLRAQVRRTITAFLLTQMNNGAFRSREPAKAFFVDVSEQLNTATVIFAGQLIVRVGLATNKPAEFVVLRISQDTRALEAELAAAGI